jgi:hypothetical protein
MTKKDKEPTDEPVDAPIKNGEEKQPEPDTMEENPDKNIDFSFKNIEQEIDAVVEKQKHNTGEDEYKIEHISDKIRFAKQIKENPPEKGFMDVSFRDAEVTGTAEYGEEFKKKGIAVITEHLDKAGKKIKKIAVYDGIFNIDLNTDAYFWFVRSCNVFPLILDQGIRTHLDIKKSYNIEKRKLEVPWALIGLGIAGFVFIILILNFLLR